MRSRSNIDDVHNRQLKLLGCLVIDARGGRASVDQSHSRNWFWQCLALLQELSSNALCQANSHLKNRALLLESNARGNWNDLTLLVLPLRTKLSV